MERVTAAVAMLAVVPLAWWLMWRGWRGRRGEQSGLPEPQPAPERPSGGWELEPVEGTYVSTTWAGRPFDRVVAHGLGVRSAAAVGLDAEGLVVERSGARSFRVPRADVRGVHRQRGAVGKFTVEEEGLVVVTWQLGETGLDTAVRCRRRADADRLVAAVSDLVGPAGGEQ